MTTTTTRQFVIHLPYRRPPLNANDRHGHWAQLAREKAQVRQTALRLARYHQLPKGLDHITVQLHYRPKDNRRRDPSNLMPTAKALVDGLAGGTKKHPGYGLVHDDNPTYVRELMPEIHPADKERGPAVWLEITTTDKEAHLK